MTAERKVRDYVYSRYIRDEATPFLAWLEAKGEHVWEQLSPDNHHGVHKCLIDLYTLEWRAETSVVLDKDEADIVRWLLTYGVTMDLYSALEKPIVAHLAARLEKAQS